MALEVWSSLALKGVLEKLGASLENALGDTLNLRFDATQAILPQLAAGARADLVILTLEAIEALQRSGAITEARTLGSSGVGVAVRAGALRSSPRSRSRIRKSARAGSISPSSPSAFISG